jgi:hypothetical protein
MAHATSLHTFGAAIAGLAEHIAFVIVGFVLVVLGLGLGVTIVMLPVGLPIGLLGLAMVIGGLTVRINQR